MRRLVRGGALVLVVSLLWWLGHQPGCPVPFELGVAAMFACVLVDRWEHP